MLLMVVCPSFSDGVGGCGRVLYCSVCGRGLHPGDCGGGFL